MRIRNTIYLDHQASTPVDPRVLAEMNPYFAESFGNPHSADHCLGWYAAQAVEKSAASVAKLIGADDDEIIFTSGATEANNLALLGIGRRALRGKRRRILVNVIEHKCVLSISRVLQDQLGYEIEYLPVDYGGRVLVEELEKSLSDDVLLVSIMAVNNEIGTIQDIETLSKIVKGHGSLFHCDAAQAPCAIDMHLMAESVDLLSLSAHKIYGPKGVGALFIRRDLQDQIEPVIYGGGQQRNLRSGTIPVALCVGMGVATAILNTKEAKHERDLLQQRRDYFVKKIMKMRWPISINGPLTQNRHPGNINICFKGFLAHDILNSLQPFVAASTGSACTSGILEPSHVLKAIHLQNQLIASSIRFSLGRSTTEEDLDEVVRLLDGTLGKLEKAGLVD